MNGGHELINKRGQSSNIRRLLIFALWVFPHSKLSSYIKACGSADCGFQRNWIENLPLRAPWLNFALKTIEQIDLESISWRN
jgi:hypothetical protein